MRTYVASALGRKGSGIDLDRFEARPDKYRWFYLEGCRPWTGPNVPGEPCKVCGGGRLRKTGYCLGCDRTGLDGKVVFPGERIGSRMDPHYRADPTACVPNAKGLAGGKAGGRVKPKGRRKRAG